MLSILFVLGFLLTALDEKSGRLLGTFNLSEGSDGGRIKSCDGLVQVILRNIPSARINSLSFVTSEYGHSSR